MIIYVMLGFLIVLFVASYDLLISKEYKNKKEEQKIKKCYAITWLIIAFTVLITAVILFDLF